MVDHRNWELGQKGILINKKQLINVQDRWWTAEIRNGVVRRMSIDKVHTTCQQPGHHSVTIFSLDDGQVLQY